MRCERSPVEVSMSSCVGVFSGCYCSGYIITNYLWFIFATTSVHLAVGCLLNSNLGLWFVNGWEFEARMQFCASMTHHTFAAARAVLLQSFLHTASQQHCPILAGSLPIRHWEQMGGQMMAGGPSTLPEGL